MRLMTDWSVITVLVLLTGCATPGPGARDLPPAELLADCPEPPGGVKTNGEVAKYVRDLKTALRGCNADKKALRDWAETP